MAPRRPTIYFVQADPPDGPVKIGFTVRRVRVRMAEGQTFVAQNLHLLAETFGTMDEEARLHALFRPHHVRGEWFAYTPTLRALVHHLILDDGSLQTWLDEHSPVSTR